MASSTRKRPKKLKSPVTNLDGKLFKDENEDKSETKDVTATLFPTVVSVTSFKAILSARFCSAIWGQITDCDETFNYWEPSHFLLYGKGFQTWEYSPVYALRSYTYLLIHVVPAWIYSNLLQPNRMLIFYFVRCLLGLFCTVCEVYFYRSVCKNFGIKVGAVMLSFLVFSPGMFISSTAFLPSSFSMYMCFLSIGAWYSQKYELAIFCTALSTFLSWPFSVLLGVPIAFDILFMKKEIKKFIQWSLISTVVILLPMVKIDSDMFGRLVVAPYNIISYNVFSSHGPDLYGTAPASFYIVNGFLNFNFVFIGALFAPLVLLLSYYFLPKQNSCKVPYWLALAPLYLWLAVFVLQPHKEERFLFPAYPLISLSGAVTVVILQQFFTLFVPDILFKRSKYIKHSNVIMSAAILVSSLFGISRLFALYQGYHAPMDLYMELNKIFAEGRIPSDFNVNICVGKEWHRFPTSFFLPHDRWNLRFIESEFRGQLPAEYSRHENATRIVHDHFNDLNLEERSRYFDIHKCHFLIDANFDKSTDLEPNYFLQKDKWLLVSQEPFLNAEKSHRFFRAFYIPFISEKYCTYADYYLLRSTKLKL